MNACECGCGLLTRLRNGVPRRFINGHNKRMVAVVKDTYRRTGRTGYVHVAVAERALGRRLPAGAVVHHVDENPLNNLTSNLVICQDAAYHKLLHYRARIVAAGGNPNTHKLCSACGLKPLTEFGPCVRDKSSGLQNLCRKCQSASYSRRKGRAA